MSKPPCPGPAWPSWASASPAEKTAPLEAAERAISHPLLEDIAISGAKGVLMNITCTSDLTMEEMTEASERIYNEVGDDAEIIWGTVVDDISVTSCGSPSSPPERDDDAGRRDRHSRGEPILNADR
jgi:cell division GTPase FtsZ